MKKLFFGYPIRFVLILILASLAGVINAQDQLLLDLLVENGVITTDQKSSIVAEYQKRKAAMDSTHVSSPGPVGERLDLLEKTVDGLGQVVAKDKKVEKLKVTGRVQVQYDHFSTDVDGGTDLEDNRRFFLRRAYLGAIAEFDNGWGGEVIADFGGGKARLDKLTGSYEVSDEAEWQIGYQKVPFGYEETTSSSKILAIERDVGTRYFNEGGSGFGVGGRHTGIYLTGKSNGLSYTAVVANSDQGEGDKSSGDTLDPGFWGRLEYKAPVDSGSFLLGVDTGFVPNGNGTGNDIFAYGFHGDYKMDNFAVRGEVLTASVDAGSMSGSANPLSISIMPSFKLSDQWEMVARYSTLDTDGHGLRARDLIRRSAVSGGDIYDEIDSLYLGMNYYINSNTVKLSFGFEHAKADNQLSGTAGSPVIGGTTETINGIRTRLQVLF